MAAKTQQERSAGESSSALIDHLVDQGFTREAAQELVRQAMDQAQGEIAAQRKVLAVRQLKYLEWLRLVSPDLQWDQPFHTLIADTVDQIVAGALFQAMFFMSPRVGKSESVTIRLPVYWLERNPKARIIVGAYNSDLATLFVSQSLALYQKRNPDMIDSEAKDNWSTIAGGQVLAVGVGSGVTGRGSDLLLIDDPVKSAEEAASAAYQNRVWNWWLNDMRTRRNNLARTPTILIQTRWHDLDLAGRILAADEKKKSWRVISLPALALENDPIGRKPGESIWEARLPRAELEDLRDDMGSRFEALYQQDPAPAEGVLIKESWFWYSVVEEETVKARCRFWDLAAAEISRVNSNPDYTVGVKQALCEISAGTMLYAVEDVQRMRMLPGERDKRIIETIRADGFDCMQYFEEGDDGDKSVTAYLREQLPNYPIVGVKPRRDKRARSSNARSALETGKVFLVQGRWNADFIYELVRFPVGRHDDQVDAWSGGYNELVMDTLQVVVTSRARKEREAPAILQGWRSASAVTSRARKEREAEREAERERRTADAAKTTGETVAAELETSFVSR